MYKTFFKVITFFLGHNDWLSRTDRKGSEKAPIRPASAAAIGFARAHSFRNNGKSAYNSSRPLGISDSRSK